MQKRKNYKRSSLLYLYLGFLFQKSTFIILILTILAMSVAIFFSSNPWLVETDYLQSSNDFHYMYLSQSILILQIFNAIIVACLVIQMTIHARNFDTLFVSHISRRSICILKWLSIAFVCFLIGVFEMALVIGIGLIRYPKFYPNLYSFLSFFYLYISMMFELMLSLVVTTILPIIFVPMGILFIEIVLKVLCNNSLVIQNFFIKLFPILKVNFMDLRLELVHPILGGVWIFLFLVLYISTYNIKDLK